MTFGRIMPLALLTGAIFSPLAASAASVSAVLYGVSDTPAGVSPGTNTLNVNFGGQADNGAYVGQLNWHNATSTDWNAGLNGKLVSILGPNATFSTYCIDGTQDVVFGALATWQGGVVPLDTTPQPGPGMGATTAAEVTEFWNRNYDSIGTGAGADMRASAFQLGLWELVNDGLGLNPFGSGSFTASGTTPGDSSAISLAGQWLGDIGSAKPIAGNYTIYTLSDGGIQDQIFGVENTPLPSAWGMGVAALAGIGLAARSRRRRVM